MSGCCTLPVENPGEVTRTLCPGCGREGKPVDLLTVKTLLRHSLMVLQGTTYRFCETETCPIVYFAEDADQTFAEEDLRVRVFQKHPRDPEVLVCYCFLHTVGEIEARARHEGPQAVSREIGQGVREGKCACETRNPQGRCCLGNVRRVEKRALQAVA